MFENFCFLYLYSFIALLPAFPGFSFNELTVRIILSGAMAFFWLLNFTFNHSLSLLVNSFLQSFIIFSPLIIFSGTIELLESMRGISLASFYGNRTNGNVLLDYIKQIVLSGILYSGGFLLLVKNLSKNLTTSLNQLYSNLINTLSLIFEFAVPIAITFLFVYIAFIATARILPNLSFFLDIFILKTTLLGIYIYFLIQSL